MILPLLGVRTDFSLGESVITADDLPKIAEQVDTDVVGVVDTMSVSSMIEASKSLKKVDKRLLVGVRVRVIMQEGKEEEACYLKLYPANEKGMKCIYRLLSRGFEEDRFYYVPRVTWSDMKEHLRDDCLVISSGDLEAVSQRKDMLTGLIDLTKSVRFLESFYELVPHGTPYYSRQNHRAMVLAGAGFKPLVVQPTMWNDGETAAFNINASISNRMNFADYLKPQTQFVPMKAADMIDASRTIIDSVEKRYNVNRQELADKVKEGFQNQKLLIDTAKYVWEAKEPSLPEVSKTPDDALTDLCKEGWKERFHNKMFGHQPTAKELQDEYLPRLQYELGILKTLGFSQYFLLVSDLVKWCKREDIFVGPGRGSVGGSLVAYLTGITDVDPIRFNLLFERFINPDRLDLPDADLDFMSTRRDEVIEYLNNRWGRENVAGMVNYNTMAAKSALRDVGRIFDMPQDVMRVTNFIDAVHGQSMSLEEAYEDSQEIQDFSQKYPEVWANALKLEGKMRAYGTHAGGVVVAGEAITNRAVVERRSNNKVINWDKRVSEDQGLIKLDILGLSTLDMFDQAIKLIMFRHTKRIDINQLELDDKKTLDIFTQAKTAGIFQFEGGSVRRLLKDMAKSADITFEDLVALNALNRPGPLDAGLTESYIRRRAGDEAVTYPHACLQPILEDTYGVICYQEQVMQVAVELSGYTAPEADILRKIMGKKLPAEMAKQRAKFVDGAVSKSGMDKGSAEQLFEDIEGFAGYAFNRSHAVEYTLIAYQAAYLKAYYGVEFYAASLGIASSDKRPNIVEKAMADGISVIPPDVNQSTHEYEPMNDTTIIAPLSAVKNVSDKGVHAIVEARNKPEAVVVETSKGRGKNKVTTTKEYGPGPFTSIEDFRERVAARACNARGLENLNAVGAFARVEPNQLPATDPSRLKDQVELMPDISTQAVAANRAIEIDEEGEVMLANNDAKLDDIFGSERAQPYFGDEAKVMVIGDVPFNDFEDLPNQFSFKEFVKPSLDEAELELEDVLWTFLLRRPKKKGETHLPKKECQQFAPFLKAEIEATKPAVIVILGTNSIRALLPDVKDINEAIGRCVYVKDWDATVIIGFNPTQIYHDKDKIAKLTAIFSTAKTLVEHL